jgi:hypothetical protein
MHRWLQEAWEKGTRACECVTPRDRERCAMAP